MSGVDVVDVDGVGGSGGAKWLAGHKDYPITSLGPLILDDELIDYVCELLYIFRYCSTAGNDSIMQAHLPA